MNTSRSPHAPPTCVQQRVVEAAPAVHVRLEGLQVLARVGHVAGHRHRLPARHPHCARHTLRRRAIDVSQGQLHATLGQRQRKVCSDAGAGACD